MARDHLMHGSAFLVWSVAIGYMAANELDAIGMALAIIAAGIGIGFVDQAARLRWAALETAKPPAVVRFPTFWRRHLLNEVSR